MDKQEFANQVGTTDNAAMNALSRGEYGMVLRDISGNFKDALLYYLEQFVRVKNQESPHFQHAHDKMEKAFNREKENHPENVLREIVEAYQTLVLKKLELYDRDAIHEQGVKAAQAAVKETRGGDALPKNLLDALQKWSREIISADMGDPSATPEKASAEVNQALNESTGDLGGKGTAALLVGAYKEAVEENLRNRGAARGAA